MHQIMRHGAYGIVLQDDCILLTHKKSGPYQGLWGLPGGAIEFGETPEATLERELKEEAALKIHKVEFFDVTTHTSSYAHNQQPCVFHQTGVLYKVLVWTEHADLISDEKTCWMPLNKAKSHLLTPFARYATAKINTWRPPIYIRSKSVALAKHKGHLLVCEVLSDERQLKGWCPLGGGIEFGETAEKALAREIKEELGCTFHICGPKAVIENIYEHHGSIGHEIVFAFPVTFDNAQIYTQKRFQIIEDSGSVHWVEWVDIQRFSSGQEKLFPPQGLELLNF